MCASSAMSQHPSVLHWISGNRGGSLKGYTLVQNRFECYDVHFKHSVPSSAWPIILNYIVGEKLEFRFNGEQMFPDRDNFRHISNEYFLPIKDAICHDIMVQGVAVITVMLSPAGDLVPVLVDMKTYDLYVGYNDVQERKMWAAVRRLPVSTVRTSVGLGTDVAIRPDLGMGLRESQDNFSFVVEFEPFTPDINGTLRSIVSTFLGEIHRYEEMDQIFMANFRKTCNPDVYVEFKDDKGKNGGESGASHASILMGRGKIAATMEDANEASVRQFRLHSEHLLALEQMRVRQRSSKRDLGRECQGVVNMFKLEAGEATYRMLPFNTKVSQNSTILSPASYDPVRAKFEQVQYAIGQAYGISSSQASQSHGVRYKVEGMIYASETEANINRFVVYINMALSKIYDILYGENNKLDAYVLMIRDTLVKMVDIRIKTEMKTIDELIEERRMEMQPDEILETERDVTARLVIEQHLVALKTQMNTVDKYRLTVASMNNELLKFASLFGKAETRQILDMSVKGSIADVAVTIPKIVMKESVASSEQLFFDFVHHIISPDEIFRLERTRLGLHSNISSKEKIAAVTAIEKRREGFIFGAAEDEGRPSTVGEPPRKKRAQGNGKKRPSAMPLDVPPSEM